MLFCCEAPETGLPSAWIFIFGWTYPLSKLFFLKCWSGPLILVHQNQNQKNDVLETTLETMYCRVLIKTEEPQLKTPSHRSQSTPDTLETQNFSTPSPSSLYHHQSVLSVMCETNVRHVHCIELYRAITGQKKNKRSKKIRVVCESGRLHTGPHNRSPLSGGPERNDRGGEVTWQINEIAIQLQDTSAWSKPNHLAQSDL